MPTPALNLKIIVSENNPSDSIQWNALATKCGNVWQSTFYDEVQLFFNNRAWYFQCYNEDKLIGGVKIYFYQSKKLPAIICSISTRATQGSEILFSDSPDIDFDKFSFQLSEEIKGWLIKKHTTSFYAYSFFGESEKLISLTGYKKIWESRIGIAVIDLTKNKDELWKKINPKHRSEIIKAEKNNVSIEFTDDIDAFFLTLDETYKNQSVHSPNKNFIRKEYEILKANGSAQLVFAKQNEKYLCGALLYNCGNNSLYNFGGAYKNSIGAGQFLQWEIIKWLKENNYENYFLGETAIENTEANLKFSQGITKFKLRFGAQQLPAQHKGFVLNPIQFWLWNMLKKLILKS